VESPALRWFVCRQGHAQPKVKSLLSLNSTVVKKR
jgi:hypothetical protein